MKTNYLIFIFLLMGVLICTYSAKAVTAYPYPVEYQLPNGGFLTVQLMGDEKVKWAETVDGYSILLNAEGFYEYAYQDINGDMVRSGIRVSNISERTPSENLFLKQLPKGLKFSKSQVSIMKQIWAINQKEGTKAFPTTGNRKLVCILIGFTDRAFIKTQADFNNLFNQVGYSAGGATGSVKDYYLENSYSQFNLTVDVAGPYTASQNTAYYGANDANGNDIRPRELVAEAVNLANPNVNYAEYDNDNDGNVDGVYIVYAGYGEEAGGGVNTIWAHAWSLYPAVYLDGKYIQSYSCSAELRGSSGTTITAIGVICHEFGHVLGAPDYYDTNYSTGGQFDGTGQWDMMAGGSWNNNGVTPAHHNGFTKVYYYNWATATVLDAGTTITLYNSAQNSNSFYRINTTTANEFFMVENREKHLFDGYIPGSGMIIYHVHSTVFSAGSNNNINNTHPQKMYPVAQNATMDPTSSPDSYGSINAATCAWTGTGKTSFTDATLPSSKSWAGANTSKPITNILRNSGNKTVTFDFMGGAAGNPTLFAALAVSASQINLSWMKNNNLDVLLAYSTSSTIGVPANGTNYSSGQSIPGGGTVIYAGGNEVYQHTGLNTNTTYYYKIWTKLNSTPQWSPGVETNTTTLCDAIATLPYSENFNASTSLPSCWSIVDNQGNGQVWLFGTHTSGLTGTTGNYAYLNSDAYGSGTSQNADLVSPLFNFSGYTDINLTFKHYFKAYSGSSAKLSYSINGGGTWTQIQQWTADTPNPATFSQVITAVAGQAQVKFKWNYTGSWGYYWDVDDVSVTGVQTGTLYSLNLIANPNNIGAILNGSGDYLAGANVNISASAVEGYSFSGWTGSAEDIALLSNASSMSTSFTMPTRAVTLTANYQQEIYTITFNVTDQSELPIENAIITINQSSSKILQIANNEQISNKIIEPQHATDRGGDISFMAIQNDVSQKFIPENSAKGTWINWDSGTNANSIGTNGVANFHVASRWLPADLTAYNGMQITKLNFFPKYADCIYTLKIWTGTNATEVYSQAVTVTINQWNEVDLTTPFTIDASAELWFGYNVNTQSGYPAGCDAGPQVAGKGNMIYWNSVWQELTVLNTALTYNWNIQAFLEASQSIVIYTDVNGQASFEGSPGDFTYTVEKEGYVTANGNFTVDSYETVIDVTLIPETNPTYNLTLVSNPSGIGAVLTGGGFYESGTVVPISASVPEGYQFVNWTQGETLISGAASFNYTMPANNVTLTANFALIPPPTYTLSLLVNPSNTGVVTGAGDYEEGEEVAITATANNGYQFVSWTQGETVISTAANFSYIMPANDVTLIANFEEIVIPTYTLTQLVNPSNYGSVTGAGIYEASTQVAITALANEGFMFVNWTSGETVISTAPNLNYTMPANDVTLTANFELLPPPVYTVTFTVTSTGQAAITGANITIEGVGGTLTTNSSGVASIDLEDGNYTFAVSASNFIAYTGSFTISGANLQVAVSMIAVAVETGTFAGVEIYPNPFSSSITINNALKVSRVVVTNLIGQKVLESELNGKANETIPTERFAKGIYLVTLYSGSGERMIRKMVKE
jgi:M6 family metalloprotease-like protein/uncharacterized repeat protein (TIGR02543 family)